MSSQKIVITGIGVVAPNGIGKEEFWKNCRAGVSGIKPITLFDTSAYDCHLGGEVSHFQPEKYLGSKGLRNLDRTTLLALVAAKLAIEDAHLDINDTNAHDIGVVLGSTMGSVHSISSFDIECLREGPRYVNPALFPNTVINAPASRIAIRFGIRGLNSTIGTGFTASLDAIEYAVDMLLSGRLKAVLVGGVEELCIETFSGFYGLHLLNGTNGIHASRRLTNGTEKASFLGEGSGVLVLELANGAKDRGAYWQAYIEEITSEFRAPATMDDYLTEEAIMTSVQQAIDRARLIKIDGVHYVSVWNGPAVHGRYGIDDALWRKTLPSEREIRICIKDLVGEGFSARGVLQLIAGIGIAKQSAGSGSLLVTDLGPIGNQSTVVISLPEHACKPVQSSR